jgi:hypothetical protein
VSPFLLTTDGADSSAAADTPALVMLVFSQWDMATESLPALHTNIAHTANGVYLITGILAGAILLCMVVIMYALIAWLTAPLSQIRLILTRIIAISAEEEARRDYSEIVDASWFDLKRSDELGCLATSFWYMVIQLHNSCEAKKARPKYTPNPLHTPLDRMLAVADLGESRASASAPPNPASLGASGVPVLLTAANFVDACELAQATPAVDPALSKVRASPSAGNVRGAAIVDGDVLAQLMQSSAYAIVDTGNGEAGILGTAADDHLSGMEMGHLSTVAHARIAPAPAQATSVYAAVSSTVEPLPVLKRTCKIFTLQFYLYTLSTALILGLMAIMAVAIFLLQHEGSGWMQDTSDTIEKAEILNLATVTLAKAAFVTVRLYLGVVHCYCYKELHSLIDVTPTVFTGVLQAGDRGYHCAKQGTHRAAGRRPDGRICALLRGRPVPGQLCAGPVQPLLLPAGRPQGNELGLLRVL